MESSVYRDMAKYENLHWWFVARRAILKSLISRFRLGGKTLEIGAGTGGNIDIFSPDAFFLEPSEEAVVFLSKSSKNIIKTTIEDFDTSELFDFIACLDVLEHLENDELALAKIMNLMSESGKLLLTVPAYMFLWSKHDEILHHNKRYTLTEIEDLLNRVGLKIEFKSYFNMLLFPLALVGRMIGKTGTRIPNKILNFIFLNIFTFEKYLLKFFNFPFGLSIVVICYRKI